MDLFAECRAAASGGCVPRAMLRTGMEVTDPHLTDDEFVARHLEEWLRP